MRARARGGKLRGVDKFRRASNISARRSILNSRLPESWRAVDAVITRRAGGGETEMINSGKTRTL